MRYWLSEKKSKLKHHADYCAGLHHRQTLLIDKHVAYLLLLHVLSHAKLVTVIGWRGDYSL